MAIEAQLGHKLPLPTCLVPVINLQVLIILHSWLACVKRDEDPT